MARLAALVCLPGATVTGAQGKRPHRLVIQVSSSDVEAHGGALRNAVNLQNALGPENVDIEVVAYGPGVGMMLAEGEHADRVAELVARGIAFSACGNTLGEMRGRGEQAALVDGVREVTAGVLRIIELQEQGYTYIRP